MGHRRVADGLGSARHADAAAIAAVRAAMEGIDTALRTTRHPQNLDFKAVTGYVAEAVRRATEALGAPHGGTNTERVPSARPGTTLTIAVVPADGAGLAVCAAVGDSPAMLISAERWRPLVGTEPKSGLVENVTVALPGDPDSVEVLAFPWEAGDLLILSSDGFAAGVMGGQTRLARLLTETWRTPPSLAEFARDVDFRLSTFDDDRTVVALWAGRHDTAVP
ncbi:protein phosphatase 2C domain-containing protein [Streptosporangium subroseum]|uniref:protein phosphatase 2C domain-containing protein n=1 Tax=Streptosporangium subroseum TaxID=106412 RepID=UPI00343D1AF7